MKKKILIASFFAAIMLIVPFNAMADDPYLPEEENPEDVDSTVDNILPTSLDDYNQLTTEEKNHIIKIIIEDLSEYYKNDAEFQQIQNIPLPGEGEGLVIVCAILLVMIIGAVAKFLDKTKDFVKDLIAKEGWIAFFDLLFLGEYGIIAIILASIFIGMCAMPAGTINENLDITKISGECECLQNSETVDLSNYFAYTEQNI